MTHNLLHWEYVLKRSGHRVTRQRTIILDAICGGGGHRAFDDIYRAVRDRDRSVDRRFTAPYTFSSNSTWWWRRRQGEQKRSTRSVNCARITILSAGPVATSKRSAIPPCERCSRRFCASIAFRSPPITWFFRDMRNLWKPRDFCVGIAIRVSHGSD